MQGTLSKDSVLLPAAECRHCGTALSPGQDQFCCGGCEVVFAIIESRGWQEYYRLRTLSDGVGVPVRQKGRNFDFLASQAYRREHCQRVGGQWRTQWFLDGIHCAACRWLIEKLARSFEGIGDLEFGSEGQLILFFEEHADLRALAEALARLGYFAGLEPHQPESSNRDLTRLGLAGAMAGNLMLFSLPFYSGLSSGREAILFGWLSMVLCLPLLAYSGREFFEKAWSALRVGAVSYDLPIAAGLLAGFVLSVNHLLVGEYHRIYFDSLGMLVFFLLIGRYFQKRGIWRALAASRRLLAGMPQMTEVWTEEGWRICPAGEIQPGDRLRLRSGDILPVDGRLESEEGWLNLHVVSGEAKPAHLQKGAEMVAGSVNLGSILEATATSGFSSSAFARLDVQAGQLCGAKRTARASHGPGLFLGAVLVCAAVGFFLWWPISPDRAWSVALSVLIVACPCALALASPTARGLAMGKAAEAGIWIKNLGVFDKLPRVREVVLDKTGVLTHGAPVLVEAVYFHPRPAWLLGAASALESATRHPLAHAFDTAPGPKPIPDKVREVRVIPGVGVCGEVDGVWVQITGPGGLERIGVSPRAMAALRLACSDLREEGSRLCLLADGEPAAVFTVRDESRPGVAEMLAGLRDRNHSVTLLSGDEAATVCAFGRRFGIAHCLGEVRPEEKLAYLKGRESDRVLMVGDGLNDMGALACAGIGLTHAGATSAAIKYADVVLREPDLRLIGKLFELVDTTRIAGRRGAQLSLIYNAAAISLAWSGAIGPLTAAVLMPLSSLSMLAAVSLSFRVRRRRWAS